MSEEMNETVLIEARECLGTVYAVMEPLEVDEQGNVRDGEARLETVAASPSAAWNAMVKMTGLSGEKLERQGYEVLALDCFARGEEIEDLEDEEEKTGEGEDEKSEGE